MIEALKSFFETYWVTLVVGVVACVCVGCLVELFKQSLFCKLEEKYKDDANKLAKAKTAKAGTAFALAALLTAFFLACIWKSDLPNIGSSAVLPIWYTAMFLFQMLVDIKGVKSILGKVLGNVVKSTEPKEEKPEKERKPKLKREKVVSYVYRDEAGNVVNPEGV